MAHKKPLTLRSLRSKNYPTLQAFCDAYNAKYKARLSSGTLSAYERKMAAMSITRFDCFAELLELSEYKKERLKLFLNSPSRRVKTHKPHAKKSRQSKVILDPQTFKVRLKESLAKAQAKAEREAIKQVREVFKDIKKRVMDNL